MKKSTLLLTIKSLRSFSSSVNVQSKHPGKYCLELVRHNDYENYLCTLLLPKNLIPAAIAIRAFNVEIALVQDQSQQATIQEMRYHFWNDTLAKIYSDNPPEAPVPLELHRILKTQNLSKRYFQRLLDARWKKWKSGMFSNLSDVEKYSEETISPLYYLILEANNLKDVHVDHVASHLGKAQGIVTLIRSIRYHAHRRVLVLPQDILINNSVSTESVFRGETSQNLSDVIFEVSSRAKQHLDKAKSLRGKINKDVSTIFLPASNVERYLDKLQKVDFNIYSPKLAKKENMLPAKLLFNKLFTKW